MRRVLAIGAVVAVLLAALGLGAGLLLVNANAKTNAWVVTESLPAGTTLDASMAHTIQVATGADAYTVLTASPIGHQLAHAMQANDVLRPDDLVSGATVQVPVTFKLAPGLSPNSVIDIYAIGGSSSNAAVSAAAGTRLIARGITVVAVGSPDVIEVPAEQEPLWVTLASSSVTLIATLSNGVSVPTTTHSYSADQALDILSQLAASNAAAGPSPTASSAAV